LPNKPNAQPGIKIILGFRASSPPGIFRLVIRGALTYMSARVTAHSIGRGRCRCTQGPRKFLVSSEGEKMLPQLSLGLEEAQRAIAAVFEQAKKDGRAVAVAVVDNHGELIAGARMDGAHARVLRHAIRKAYTAAVMGRDTLALKEDMEKAGRTLSDYGDSSITTLQGGLVARSGNQVVGAIASGGSPRLRDVEMAKIGLDAMGL
jgi:glc operon protein GlcG